MTLRWLAEGLDRVFIDLSIRPRLPLVALDSRFTRLRQAEERTRISLPEDGLFSATLVAKPTITRSRTFAGGRRELTVCWPAPLVNLEIDWFPEIQPTLQAKSLWYLRNAPRPLVVLVGGWMPFPGMSARLLWPVKQLDRAGYDVVLPILAGHAEGYLGAAPNAFPGRDPSRNIIELAKGTTTIGQLLQLGHDRGHEPILIWGASLGAHLVALLATLRGSAHGNLFVLEKPLSRLSDPLRLHGAGASHWRQRCAERLDQVYRGVSPLDRLPRVDPKQMLVIGGEFDQVTPIATVELIATHFNATLRQIKASHLLDSNRSDRMLALLERAEP